MKKFTQIYNEQTAIGTSQTAVKTQPQTKIITNGEDIPAQNAQYTVLSQAQNSGQTSTDVAKTQVKTQGQEQKVKSCKYITMDLISMLKDIQQQNKNLEEVINKLKPKEIGDGKTKRSITKDSTEQLMQKLKSDKYTDEQKKEIKQLLSGRIEKKKGKLTSAQEEYGQNTQTTQQTNNTNSTAGSNTTLNYTN